MLSQLEELGGRGVDSLNDFDIVKWPFPGDVPFSDGQLVVVGGSYAWMSFPCFRRISVNENNASMIVFDEVKVDVDSLAMVLEHRDPLTFNETRTSPDYVVRILSSKGPVWIAREHLIPL